MKCLLCSMQFIRVDVLEKYYVDYHSINQENIFYSALEVVKNNKHFLNNSLDLSFDKDRAKEMVRRK